MDSGIYLIVNPAFPEWTKVGLASESVIKRLSSYQTGDPHRDYAIHTHYPCAPEDTRKLEKECHSLLEEMLGRHNRKREWFNATPPAIAIYLNDIFTE
jgi:hypothetical protein